MIGKTISHYKILSKLGEGGMGVVYKAEDTKLKRTVALKFLPTHTIASEDEKKRFIQEAQAAASLSQANIATIYGFDEHDGDMFIVMEYIEGQTLRDKIKEGPLRLKDAIKISKQIAEGLYAAHEQGVIHRDIKSANIMLTKKNHVKIMDFGLAKMKTVTGITKQGIKLGTVSSMSPEQTRGEEVDHRTDIWAAGVVMYEMIAGQLPFKGEYETAVVYSIMNVEPEPLTAVRTGVPMDLEKIVNKLLAKEPEDRYQNIIELPVDLKNVDLTSISSSQLSTSATMNESIKKPYKWNTILSWSLVIILMIIFILYIIIERADPINPPTYSSIPLDKEAPFEPIGNAYARWGQRSLAISPNGDWLVYVALIGEETMLYKKSLRNFEPAEPMDGTEGAFYPFFSPNSKDVGFFTRVELKRVSIEGNRAVPIIELSGSAGAVWRKDKTIILLHDEGAAISKINENGDGFILLKRYPRISYQPHLLPDQKTILVSNPIEGIYAIRLETGELIPIFRNGKNPVYLSSGHILFIREGVLHIAEFDINKLKVTGQVLALKEKVRVEAVFGAAQLDISDNGTLVYSSGKSLLKSKFVWKYLNGKEEHLDFPEKEYGHFNISPDGKKLAVTIYGSKPDIWIYDLEKHDESRLTTEGDNYMHCWSNDSKEVFYTSKTGETQTLYRKSISTTNEPIEVMKEEELLIPWFSSNDGNSLFYGDKKDLFVYDIIGDESKPIMESDATKILYSLSRDGKYMLYLSNRNGKFNVYATPFPKANAEIQIYPDDGETPVWSKNEDKLFYTNDEKYFEVTYSTKPEFDTGNPKLLFEGNYLNVIGADLDISADGQKFLLLKSVDDNFDPFSFNIVTNWLEELKDKFKDQNK